MHTLKVSQLAVDELRDHGHVVDGTELATALEGARRIRRGASGVERQLLLDLDVPADALVLAQLHLAAKSQLAALFVSPPPDDKSERIALASRQRAMRLLVDRCAALLREGSPVELLVDEPSESVTDE